MALLGIVILQKPTVSGAPVSVRDRVVVAFAGFVEIVTLDICEAVTFPAIRIGNGAPAGFVAITSTAGVGIGARAEVGVGVEEGVGVGLAVGLGVADCV